MVVSNTCTTLTRSPRSRPPQITADVAYDMVMYLSNQSKSKQTSAEEEKVPQLCASTGTSSWQSTTRTRTAMQPSDCAKPQHKGFRKDYALGEPLRSLSDKIEEPTPAQALQAVDQLQRHDFAWVKRSDGTYTYAIIAYRTEDTLTFVISEDFISAKTLNKSHWKDCVKLVNTTERLLDLPSSISFVQNSNDDDCSLISAYYC